MSNVQQNDFNISGRVVFVGMPIFYTEKTSKRLLVLEVYVRGGYRDFRNEVPIEYANDNMPLLDNIRERDWVNINFRIGGRGKVMTDGKKRWWPNLEGLSCVKEDD